MEDVCEIAEEFVEVRIGGGGCESVVGIGVIWSSSWTVGWRGRGAHDYEERWPKGILARDKMIAIVLQVLGVRIKKNCSNSCENCSRQICGS